MYEVTRSWGKASTGRVSERLDVKRNEESLGDLGSEQWQDFIRELIPLGVSSLFFFDGEKIQHLAEDATDQVELAQSVKALLGIHLIERLYTDLTIYQGRLGKSNGHISHKNALDALNEQLHAADSQLSHRRDEYRRLEASVSELRGRLAQIEQSISAEGGGFAKRRDALVRKREEARAKVEANENSIRQICQGLLPFALAPHLLREVEEQIHTEEITQSKEVGKSLLASARQQFVSLIEAEPEFAKKPARVRDRAIQLLDSAIAHINVPAADASTVIHGLSASTARQVLSWIHQSLADLPRTARSIGDELEAAARDLQRAEEELKKIPADEVLAPLVDRLNSINQEIGDATRQLLTAEAGVREAETRVAELQKRIKTEIDKLHREAAIHSRLRLLPRVQTALDEFSHGLIAQRVKQLESELTNCFNVLSRKSDSVRRASISPVDFSVTLYDRSDAPIPKQALSAGEKQIYAIAVLWALARVSRRPLPLIIDTPLGRLDSDHRRLLVEGYFPNASHQVILLSTDTEVDHAYFTALKPHVARAYRLEFDMLERCTMIEPGYFDRMPA
jgi:DNA sulfur modification protein DndD